MNDKPRLEVDDEYEKWLLKRKLLNEQPILEVDQYGSKEWKLKGSFHRKDGPAIEWINGYKAWYLYGKRHRIDGPAVIWSNGYKSWYLCGRNYTYGEWFQRLTPKQQYDYLWKLDE
jgi:hypothetical protein